MGIEEIFHQIGKVYLDPKNGYSAMEKQATLKLDNKKTKINNKLKCCSKEWKNENCLINY